jgi:hypothetical protein
LSWLVLHSVTAFVAVGSGVVVSLVGRGVGDVVGVRVAVCVAVGGGDVLVGVVVGVAVAVGVLMLAAAWTIGVGVSNGGVVGVFVGVGVASVAFPHPGIEIAIKSVVTSSKTGICTGRDIFIGVSSVKIVSQDT